MIFEVGDRVVTTGAKWGGYLGNRQATIVAPDTQWADSWLIRIDGFEYDETFDGIDAHPAPASAINLVASVDNVNPNHYKFPSGAEVKDISGHLTSFGGQALQYIARATRLDGNNKGESVEDLKKALRFVQWEIERLEAQ